MADTNHYGLLLVMMEPPEEMEEEFNEWYDSEHIPEREAVPGIMSARRFVVYQGSPRYLALYDLKSIKVLRSESYKRIGVENLSPWSRRIIRYVREFKRNIYRQVTPGTSEISKEGKALALWAYDINTGIDNELNQWYEGECLTQLKSVEGFINLRRFICVEGFPAHLTLLDFKDAECFEDEAYKKALLFQETGKFKNLLTEAIHNLYTIHIF